MFFTFPLSPVACAAHQLNAAGDDARGIATSCDDGFKRCDKDEDVTSTLNVQFKGQHIFTCLACDAGKSKALDTDNLGLERKQANVGACVATLCAIDEHVVNHVCTPCPTNTVKSAGDNAFLSANTLCTHGSVGQHAWEGMEGEADHEAITTTCLVDQMVRNHACVSCPSDHYAPAGALRVGDDTYCTKTSLVAIDHSDTSKDRCAKNWHVLNHACVACADYYVNDAGDDRHHQNTYCTKELGGADIADLGYVKHLSVHTAPTTASTTAAPTTATTTPT